MNTTASLFSQGCLFSGLANWARSLAYAGGGRIRRLMAGVIAFSALAGSAAAAPAVTGVDTPVAGAYPGGANLDFFVFFNEPVNITGLPRIQVTMNSGVVYANYFSGSGSTTIRFRYVTAPGDSDPDGIALAGSIDLNGATIRNGALQDSSLLLVNVGPTAGIIVEAVPLVVTSVTVPSSGLYKAGSTLDFTVNLNKVANLSTGGLPFLPITLDSGGAPFAIYVSGSGSSALLFRYTVATTDLDPTGLLLSGTINLNGATLRDAALNDVVPTLNGIGGTSAVVIDGVAPTVVSSNRVGPASTLATSVAFTVTFNEAVSGVDLADFELTKTGTATGILNSLVPTSPGTFTVNVTGVGGDGSLRVDLKSSGTGIVDAAGNGALVGFTGGQTITVDNSVPTAAIGAPSTPDTDSGPLSFTIAYSGADIITLSPGDVTLNTTGGVTATLQVSGTGLAERVVTLTNIQGAGTIGITIAAGTASDLAGNVAPGAGPSVAVAANQSPTLAQAISAKSVGYKTPFIYVVPAGMFVDPNPGQTLTYSASGMPDGITFNPATRMFGGTAAIGTSVIVVTATDDGTPARSSSSSFTLSVIKAVITVKADDKTRPYGAANPTLSATMTGFVGGETLETSGITGAPALATTATTASFVGTFPITTNPGTLAAANYSFVMAPGTLTVSKAVLTVKADDKSRAYNTLTPTLTASITGFVNGETSAVLLGAPILSTTATATSNIGTYPITVDIGSLQATNYAFTSLINGTLTISASQLTIVLEGLSRVYNGQPQPVSASTTPSGSPLLFTYDGSPTAPTNAGSYAVQATSADPNFGGTATGTLVIAKASQTLTFNLPAITIGVPVPLAATASSGLPVSFSIVSGNATIAGNLLTVNDGALVTVRAQQVGDGNHNPVLVDRSTGSSNRAAQSIHAAAPGDKLTTSAPFTVVATATSGLPVTLTLVSGPATLSGSVVTLTGAAGTVVIRLSQAGNATYLPAADVLLSIAVSSTGASTYFGAVQSGAGGTRNGDIGATYQAASNQGTLLILAPTLLVNTVVDFTLTGSSFTRTVEVSNGTPIPLTITGQISNGVLSGTIEPIGQTFNASLLPTEGSQAPFAGFYRLTALGSSKGATYAAVSAQNQILVLSVLPLSRISGSTTLAGDGTFSFTSGSTVVQGRLDAATGSITCTVAPQSLPAIAFAGVRSSIAPNDRLVNVSARSIANGAANPLITGFVIAGASPKTVLVRGVGPGLQPYGVQGYLETPTIQLFSGGTKVGENTGWGTSPNLSEVRTAFARVGAFPLAEGSADSALLVTLNPGGYTVHVSGGTGVALAEVYDASANPQLESQRLVNVSVRNEAGSGNETLICGFIVSGNSPKRVLIRGIGPTLSDYGVQGFLADTQLKVFTGETLLGENDNWSSDSALALVNSQAASATGAFALPLGSKDSAIVLTLAPGAYTAHVSSAVADVKGVALIETYEVP
ncbi:MAG: hypothetical protein KBA71_12580 [Opitutaceae bacterium]|nr:hypothetical protein [Opitutaceae bacterium]